ncbi:MAG: helix-turn-helix domain-containing protein [Clostridiaceae bacterium]|nr:helix-turn-helix domain-containing protein [Clostridiaceae bacterium]MBW4859550.1 helix-turn-helix domain-containing protein [Clostridiaceae bacterium]MBW4867395.1 helix-turn-helix domain-containing protein [Clostridiaceae bacterium]
MMKQNELKSYNKLIFPVIEAATEGNSEAINTVVKHYEGYIAVLATRKFYDTSGNPHLYVDEDLRRRLEIKLITGILAFKVA